MTKTAIYSHGPWATLREPEDLHKWNGPRTKKQKPTPCILCSVAPADNDHDWCELCLRMQNLAANMCLIGLLAGYWKTPL